MVRTPCWLAGCVLMVAVHLPAPAFAQDASAKRDSAVTRLETGQQIRISGEAMSRLTGKAGVASNDTLDFAQDDMVRRIPIPAIDTLWVRGGSGRNGALIGAGAMLVIYVVLIWYYAHKMGQLDREYGVAEGED